MAIVATSCPRPLWRVRIASALAVKVTPITVAASVGLGKASCKVTPLATCGLMPTGTQGPWGALLQNATAGLLHGDTNAEFPKYPQLNSIDALPEDVREWVRDNEVMQGDTDPEPPAEESTGAFDWKVWEDAPDDWKNGLKKIKANKKMTVYGQAEQAANMPCNVRLARCDLNGDGQLGTIVTYSCGFWCGQLGCAFNVYEGGRRISLVDVIDEVRPGKGGVISSKGVLLKLKKY